MDALIRDFARVYNAEDGYGLEAILSPLAPLNDSGRLYALHRGTNAYSVQSDVRAGLNALRLDKAEANVWLEVFVVYWKAVGEILAAEEATNVGKSNGSSHAGGANWLKVYEAWRDVLNAVYRGYQSQQFELWTIPALYVTGRSLRVFAIKADASLSTKKGGAIAHNAGFQDDITDDEGGNETLADAARQINKVFGLCLSDRAPPMESRKWGSYYIANLLFKTYFKLNSISLCKNLLRSIAAQDMPPFEGYPRSHQVTYNYYVGVLHFLDENYVKAEEHLNTAYAKSQTGAKGNIQLILTYLIPTRLLTSHVLPTNALLAPYPRLQRHFAPLSACIKRGDLAGFDAALQAGEDEFVKRRIYLTLERGRDVCLRNLFRKVYVSGGYEVPKAGQESAERVRRSRVPIAEFGAALKVAGEKEMEGDEIECLIANLIYKNLLKGYISRAHSMVVLNKKGAFPGTGV